MRIFTLLARNLGWYWRTNLAVLLGVATAVAVFAGALVVGDSVRASLRDLVLGRLGNTDYVVSRNGFFREQLAAELESAVPIIALEGVVRHESSGRRAGRVQVYGVDERFGVAPRGREALLTQALRDELGSKPGDSILVRVEKPSAIPLESLHGRKEDAGKSLRLSVGEAPAREFSLQPSQADVRAVFISLARMQRELAQPGKVNAILVTGPSPERALKERFTLEDLGLKLRLLEQQHCLSLESDSALIPDAIAETAMAEARRLNLRAARVLTYLANTIRVNGREIPYSLVTALEDAADGVTLNAWAARELNAKPGDAVALDYFVWKSDGRLHTETAQFPLARIVPMEGAALDRDLAPDYPGITEAASLAEWDPPFPIDLKRVRPSDEEYWNKYRTTPKAFVPLARGQQLWQTRFGKLTSIRIFTTGVEWYRSALRQALDPARAGFTAIAVKAQGLQASSGATDFGEYFLYFSFFLMASALLLTGLFFKLGLEQRLAEIGLLRAFGFSMSAIRRIFLGEGAILAAAGALLGIAGALAYGALIMLGLRTWWIGAVGTKSLSLHASGAALATGAAAGIITGLATIAWTLRKLMPATPRGLIAGESRSVGKSRARWIGAACAVAAAGALAASSSNQTAAFFVAGTLLLIASLSLIHSGLHSRSFAFIRGQFTLGVRSATYRPGRSTLCIALIASATFLIVSIDAFRREPTNTTGFPLMAESVLPLIHDPNTPGGREALNLPPLEGVRLLPFRLRPGDDASCLNLYRPQNPRMIAPAGNFFHGDPWTLLDAAQPDGATPVIGDATSLTYALHMKVGDEFTEAGHRFRIVGALHDSIFQGELIVSERNFLRLFPDVEGYRFFVIEVSPQKAAEVTAALEQALSDYGFDVEPTEARLAAYHRVENTYLSTFRTLGALGLVLGTVGLAAVLLRNVLERRRELALLRAVGFRPGHLMAMVLAENALLLVAGLATGAVCALVAITPAVTSRGGQVPLISIAVLLVAVLATGFAASLVATRVALRSPLLVALRSE